MVWTQNEEQLLRDNFNALSYNDLCRLLNRSPGAIHSKARRLGLGHKILLDIVDPICSEEDGHWIAGFTDGEGCFCVIIKIKPNGNAQVTPMFKINLRHDDINTLQIIRKTLQLPVKSVRKISVGNAPSNKNKNTQDQAVLCVSGYKMCQYVMRPFFERFRLRSKKRESFKTWCKILDIMTSTNGLCSKLSPKEILRIHRLRKGMNQNDNQKDLFYDKETQTFSRVRL